MLHSILNQSIVYRASSLHIRALCPALPHVPQRLKDRMPILTRTLFFAFFPLLEALNSFRIASRTPLLNVYNPSCCIRSLLCDL
jgi:hypothetical protein